MHWCCCLLWALNAWVYTEKKKKIQSYHCCSCAWFCFCWYCVQRAVYMQRVTEHFHRPGDNVWIITKSKILHIQQKLTYLYHGHTVHNIFLSAGGKWRKLAGYWVIVPHHILSPNSQEAPEWNESTNCVIFHADEYVLSLFVNCFFVFPTSRCDF